MALYQFVKWQLKYGLRNFDKWNKNYVINLYKISGMVKPLLFDNWSAILILFYYRFLGREIVKWRPLKFKAI